MRVGLVVFALCGTELLQPVSTTAQGAPIELGVDISFDMSAGDGTTSVLSIPDQSVRMGVFVSDLVSIENRMSFERSDMEGDEPSTRLSLQMSGVIHATRDRSQSQLYAIPSFGLRSSFSGERSGSQLELGCGVGVKVPIADHLSGRFEAGYWYGSGNEDFERFDTVTLKVGVSLFTK